MKMLVPDSQMLWWQEILPLTIVFSILCYATLVWNPLVGIVLVIPMMVLGYVFDAERMWWIVVGLVPLSLNTEILVQGQVGMYLPTEPMLFGFLLLSILYFFKRPVDIRFLNHPISWMMILYFGWMFITVWTSTSPWISLKSFIVQMWYVVPITYLGSVVMKNKLNRKRFLNIYLTGFVVVVVYTLFRLWNQGFPERESQWLMQPFFKDHTLLGAVLGLVLPYIYLRCLEPSARLNQRIIWIALGMACTLVLIFTYSRAAILSLAVAGGLYVLLRLQIPFRYLIIAGLLMGGLLLWNQDVLVEKLSSNRAESSGEVIENIESISNISTDASNLERINRWNSALEMWKDKPLVGWGPGTYQFEYAPFQKSADLTIISTNVGDVGNAHSEFLGTLSESGAPALVLLILLVLTTIGTGYRNAMQLKGSDRLLLTAVLLGYVAYFTHGILNNFLNSDKAAVLIWGFTAIIIHYDLDHNTQKK